MQAVTGQYYICSKIDFIFVPENIDNPPTFPFLLFFENIIKLIRK